MFHIFFHIKKACFIFWRICIYGDTLADAEWKFYVRTLDKLTLKVDPNTPANKLPSASMQAQKKT